MAVGMPARIALDRDLHPVMSAGVLPGALGVAVTDLVDALDEADLVSPAANIRGVEPTVGQEEVDLILVQVWRDITLPLIKDR
jgi:hypothetical protein